MKNRSNKYILYVILCVAVAVVAYTACKDITPNQQRVENAIELKLSK